MKIESAFARGDLSGLLSQEPLRDPYWQAFLRYRIASLALQTQRRQLAREHIKLGITSIGEFRDAHPEDPEGLVLAAMLNGQRFISRRVLNFLSGWRAYRLMQRAEKLDATNPRLQLMKGVGQFLAPRLLGYDIDDAHRTLSAGLAALKNEPCIAGEWAEVDLHLWQGRVLRALGREDQADGQFERALALSPGNVWVLAARDGEGYVWSDGD